MVVRVVGAPGFEDFDAEVVPGMGDIAAVDSRGNLAVVTCVCSGEPFVIPAKFVHKVGEPETREPLQVGDTVRVLTSGYMFARVNCGDFLKVVAAPGGAEQFETEAPRLYSIDTTWTFELADEGVHWERA